MPAVAEPILSVPEFMPTPPRFRWDQYEQMIASGALDGLRTMFIDGELIQMAAMYEPHMSGISLMLHELQKIFGTGFYIRVQGPLRQGNNDPEPDLCVVPGGPKTYKKMPTSALLVVEVADSLLRYDTTKKAEIYAAAGTPDYWVLDLESRRLLVFRDPDAAGYLTQLTFAETASVAPLAMPSASIRVADLLP